MFEPHDSYGGQPPRSKVIQAANAGTFNSSMEGMLHLDFPIDNHGNTRTVPLHNALLCPNIPNTLISLGKLDNDGYNIHIGNGLLTMTDPSNRIVARIPKIHGLYQIPMEEHAYVAKDRLVSLYDAHCILGHQNYAYIKHLFAHNQINGMRLDKSHMDEPECRTCLLAKAARFPIAKLRSSPRAENYGDVFHMDVWGPASVQTINRCTYALTIVDEATLWLEEPLLKSKDEAFTQYIIIQTNLQTQYGITVKILHSDRGGEFLS